MVSLQYVFFRGSKIRDLNLTNLSNQSYYLSIVILDETFLTEATEEAVLFIMLSLMPVSVNL